MRGTHVAIAALCMVVLGCGGGGSGGSGGNAAEGKTFDYGTPTTASSSQTSAAQSSLSGAVNLQTSNASAATSLASAQNLTVILLGSYSASRNPEAPEALIRAAGSEDGARSLGLSASCTTTTATSIIFTNCSYDEGGSHFALDGHFNVSADRQTLDWDLVLKGSTSSSSGSVTYQFHESGKVIVTASTVKGNMLVEWSSSATANGTTYSFGLSEAVVLDLTFKSNPFCITSGTVEVKRVWTQRPSGSTTSNLPDKAAKVTWTGCNQATIARSK